MPDGGTERRVSAAASSPEHFSSSVSRWSRRNLASTSRSPRGSPPSSRGSSSGLTNTFDEPDCGTD
jgi:hypothetical protein